MMNLYWDTIEVGDPVTPLTKPPVTRVQIAKFAGAAQDYSPLHIDDDFAKSAGYGGVFAHGAITLGFAVESISRWAENGRLLAASATFQKLVWPGDILTAKGVVVNRYEHNGEFRIDVDVWAENQNHDIVMKGQITVVLWRNEKEEKKGKGIWPPVSAETVAERRVPTPAERQPEVRVQKEAAPAKAEKPAEKPEKPAAKAEKPAAKPAKPAAKAEKPAAKKAPAKKAAKKGTAKAPPKAPKKAAAKKAAAKPAKKAAGKGAASKKAKRRK